MMLLWRHSHVTQFSSQSSMFAYESKQWTHCPNTFKQIYPHFIAISSFCRISVPIQLIIKLLKSVSSGKRIPFYQLPNFRRNATIPYQYLCVWIFTAKCSSLCLCQVNACENKLWKLNWFLITTYSKQIYTE